jgi:predicted amidohydrolase YtcJ
MALTPGIVDGHIHPFWGTKFAVGADCTQISDLDGLRAALRAERDRAGAGAVVRGWGVEYGVFAGCGMEGTVLEELAGGPALITFMDLHTYLATPSVMGMAEVTEPVSFPDASEIVFRDGVPTGELREFGAFDRVADRLPGVTAQAQRDRAAELLAHLNSLGLTGLHVMDGSPATFGALRELEAEGRLTARMVVPLWVQPQMSDEEIAELLTYRGERGRLWRGGVAKFFIDGVVETGTSWLEEPDTRGGGTAPFWPDPERFAAVVARFAGAGFQCATHAIGDRAVRATLDAYRAAGAAPGVRHRIEHAESLADRELARYAAEGVVASMQPLHMQWREDDDSDEWATRLGPERAARAFRTGDLLASGATVVLGSDWPVAGNDPRVGMAWARLRRAPGATEGRVFEPDQALSAEATLAGYTQAAAYVAGEEAESGRIAVGMRADLTGFAEDPVDVPADELPALPVRLTVVDGRVVHRG